MFNSDWNPSFEKDYTLEVHFGGHFADTHELKEYIGGFVENIAPIDPDKISMLDLKDMTEVLVTDTSVSIYYRNLMTGELRELQTDRDLLGMFQAHQRFSIVKLFLVVTSPNVEGDVTNLENEDENGDEALTDDAAVDVALNGLDTAVDVALNGLDAAVDVAVNDVAVGDVALNGLDVVVDMAVNDATVGDVALNDRIESDEDENDGSQNDNENEEESDGSQPAAKILSDEDVNDDDLHSEYAPSEELQSLVGSSDDEYTCNSYPETLMWVEMLGMFQEVALRGVDQVL